MCVCVCVHAYTILCKSQVCVHVCLKYSRTQAPQSFALKRSESLGTRLCLEYTERIGVNRGRKRERE